VTAFSVYFALYNAKKGTSFLQQI